MNDKNICKFISETATDKLEVARFIFESNSETMKEERTVRENRITLVKQGKGKIVIDGVAHAVEPGSLIFVFKDEKMYMTPEETMEYMYIDFSGSRSESLFSRFGINKSNRIFRGYDGLIPMWHDSLCRANEINIDLEQLTGINKIE